MLTITNQEIVDFADALDNALEGRNPSEIQQATGWPIETVEKLFEVYQEIRDDNNERNGQVMSFVLPEFWLPALINDDVTGMSDEEERGLNAFLSDLRDQYGDYYATATYEDAEYVSWHDAKPYGVGPCDCVEVVFVRLVR